MPCWEVRTLSVEFQAKYRDLLEEAIADLGWSLDQLKEGRWQIFPQGATSFLVDLDQGKATITDGQQRHLNQLKVAYSQAAVRKVAKKRGWKTKFTSPTKGKFTKKQWV